METLSVEPFEIAFNEQRCHVALGFCAGFTGRLRIII